MGWFSKKRGESEEAVQLPELPDIEDELTFNPENLPRLPQESFNINERLPDKKEDYVDKPVISHLPRQDFDGHMQKTNWVKEEIKNPMHSSLPKKIIPRPPVHSPELPRTNPQIKEKPIYIRLDKFEATGEHFEEIKKRVIEIESFLKGIREIKAKEEKELEEWERELQIIKTRIESIDREIFSKLD